MKDLAENGIEIELMHIGSSFDASAFYKVSGWMGIRMDTMYGTSSCCNALMLVVHFHK